MSTKLYNGLRVRCENPDLFSIVSDVARVIRETHKRSARELVGNTMADFVLEPRNLENLSDDDYLFSVVEKNWNEEQAKFGSRHALNDPLRFSIVFGLSNKGNLLAYYFSGNDRSYREALDSLGIFEDYHYQNQSDHPEEFTEEQWRARGEEWDSVLNEEGTLGDLPGWSLEGSDRPFMEAYLSSNEINLNDYASERRRYARAHLNELVARVFERFPERRKDSPFRVIIDLKLLVRDFSEAGGFDKLPALEPFPRGTLFTIAELPAPVVCDEEILKELFARYSANSD